MVLKNNREIMLASTSESRKSMLEAAGLAFGVVPPDVNEQAVMETVGGGDMPPSDIAEMLARVKAETVSGGLGDEIVIGGDQVLVCDGRVFTKCANMDEAWAALIELRGKVHELHSAVAVAKGGTVRWAHVDVARLRMRDFSNSFLGEYMAAAGERILYSVGCYEIEGLGVQLFDEVDGDQFTIRGLPLVALLNYLREEGIVDA